MAGLLFSGREVDQPRGKVSCHVKISLRESERVLSTLCGKDEVRDELAEGLAEIEDITDPCACPLNAH